MKRILAALCLAALLPVLFACGQTEPETTAETTPSPERTAIPEAGADALRLKSFNVSANGDPVVDINGNPAKAFCVDTADFVIEQRDGGVYITYTAGAVEEGGVLTLPAYVDDLPLLGVDAMGFKNIFCKELRVSETMRTMHLSTCQIETIVIPKALETISFDRSYYKNAEVDAANPSLGEIDGVLYSKASAALIKYPFLRTDKSYTVPAELQAIQAQAFTNYHVESPLEEIIIPSTVTGFPQDSTDSLHCGAVIVAKADSAAAAYVKKCREAKEDTLPEMREP